MTRAILLIVVCITTFIIMTREREAKLRILDCQASGALKTIVICGNTTDCEEETK